MKYALGFEDAKNERKGLQVTHTLVVGSAFLPQKLLVFKNFLIYAYILACIRI
jgi:hypothetical protein